MRLLARLLAIFLLMLLPFSMLSKPLRAAIYSPDSWYVTAGGAYEVVSPGDLNNKSNNIAKLEGLWSGSLQVEHGIYTPDWTHWAEFGYHYNKVSGETTGTPKNRIPLTTYTHTSAYMSAVPLGATYWMARTSYIDFGLSLGVGMGFSPKSTIVKAEKDKDTITSSYKGGISPIAIGRITSRFWISKYFSFGLVGGMQYYKPTFVSTSGDKITGNFFGMSAMGVITFAFGGAKGTGRAYVEVIPATPIKQPTPKRSAPTRTLEPQKK